MSTPSFNETHPELNEGEVFLTNSDERPAIRIQGRPIKSTNYSIIPFSTKRKGKTSYNVHGLPNGKDWPESFPVFVSKAEIDKLGGIEEARKMVPLSHPHERLDSR
jgi:hypothetical protein